MAPHEAIGRREFMTQAAVTVTAAAMFAVEGGESAAAAGSQPPVVKIDVKTATSATFKALIGQTFQISGTQQKVVLEKIEVTPDRNRAKRPRNIRQESFLLLFSAPIGVNMSPGIYTFSNSTRGPFSVFVNEVRMTSTLSTNSALGQAERFLGIVAENVKSKPAKVYYQVPFS